MDSAVSRVRVISRLRRQVAVLVAVALALLGVTVVAATSNPAVAAITQTPVTNPPLPAKCGLKLAIVYDLSLSVDTTELTQMKAAGTSVVTALTGTASQIGVYTFATYAPAFNSFMSGLPAGNATLNAVSIADEAGARRVSEHINGLSLVSGSTAGYTNWQAGLAQLHGLGYDGVLFVTDGDPTAHGIGSNVNRSSDVNNIRDADVDAAITSANTLKTTGTRVIAVGIGASGTASINRLRLITSGDASQLNSDYFVTDFANLGAVLGEAATRTCQGTVTISKLVQGLDHSVAPVPAGGWSFHAASSAGAVVPSEAETADNGTVNFVVPSGGGASSTATFHEIQQEGHRLVGQIQQTNGGGERNATCRANDAPIPVDDVATTPPADAGFSVAVGSQDVVTCTVINEVIPAHLTLRKQVVNLTPNRAQPDDWTLHAHGPGPSPLSGNDTGTGVSANVLPGEYTLSETADPSIADAYTASAWVCSGEGVTHAAGSAQVTLADDADATCTITNTERPVVRLVQNKEVDPDGQIAETGDPLTYKLTVHNTGTGEATGVEATDTLPDGVEFVSADHDGIAAGQVVTWTGLTIPAGGTLTLTVEVTVTASPPAGEQTTLTNRFQVTRPDDAEPNVVENPCADNAAQSCAETVVVGPDSAPELTQSKVVDLTTAAVGDTLTYTMQVRNTGNTTRTGITATDMLPDGVTFVSADPSQGTYAPSTGVWMIGLLAPSESATLTIEATVNESTETTTLTNQFKLTPQDGVSVVVEHECTDDETSSCAVTEVPGVPRLVLDKTVDKDTAEAGDILTYTVTVHNTGTAAATDLVAHDTIPTGTTFVAVDTHGHGTFDSSTGSWHLGTLNAGDTARITLQVKIAPDAEATTVINRVGILVPPDVPAPPTVEHPCPDNEHESCAETVIPGVPRLTQSKVVDRLTAKPGQTLTYTLTVANTGTTAANGVVAHDTLPDGVSFLSSNTHGSGSFDASTGTWHIGSIEIGQTVVLTIMARLDSGTENTLQLNRFVVSPPPGTPPPVVNQSCPDDESASCGVTEVLGTPQLVQGKTVDRHSAAVGDRLTYILTITNRGTGAALGVVARDVMPAGVSLVSANTHGLGVLDTDTLTWTVPLLEVGVTATLTLVVTILPSAAGQTLTNALEVTAPAGAGETTVQDPCPTKPGESCATTTVASSATGGASLAATGGNVIALSGWALALLLSGAGLLALGRRRWQR